MRIIKSSESLGFVIWLTGLPGSGKTTLAKSLENDLCLRGLKVEVLDGDEVRKNLSPELGFSRVDRELHAKRVAYLSHLLSRNGIITIVALVSPYTSSREYARKMIGRFVEVWVNCSVDVCYKRDPKGLYKKAMEGMIINLTGVQDPYEPPTNPELIVNTEYETPNIGNKKIIRLLYDLKFIV